MATNKPSKAPVRNRLTPEAREKLSQLAKERHAAGKFGGSRFGKLGGRGRTREKRLAAEMVAEEAQKPEVQKAIVQVLKDAIDPSQNIMVRLKGVDAFVNIEKDNQKMQLARESAKEQQKTREELLEILKDKLTAGPVSGIIRRQMEQEAGIVDAEVVEVDDDEQDAAA